MRRVGSFYCIIFALIMLAAPVFAEPAQGPVTKPVVKDVKSPASPAAHSLGHKMAAFFDSLVPARDSVIREKVKAANRIRNTQSAITLFEPTYVMPFYYTARPYQSVYAGNTPDDQRIMPEEFKAQMSFLFVLWHNMFSSPFDLNVSYTQLSYWQFYANSQFFRETDYEPAIFLSDHFADNWLGFLGVVHQSNGRGGDLERSWNRLYATVLTSGDNWLIGVQPWILIFQKDSSDLHNPDIAHYLGYGREIAAVTFWHQEVSLVLQNAFESGFKRGAVTVGYSFPIYGKLRFYAQFFTGYGQSLIEYNHYTKAFGIGIALNDWI